MADVAKDDLFNWNKNHNPAILNMLNLTPIRSVNLEEKQWPNQLNVQIFYLDQLKCGLRSFTLELSSADYEHLKHNPLFRNDSHNFSVNLGVSIHYHHVCCVIITSLWTHLWGKEWYSLRSRSTSTQVREYNRLYILLPPTAMLVVIHQNWCYI